MDAVKFLKERDRMCQSFIGSCDGCPLADEDSLACENVDADTQVKAVEKWSKEHPPKTRMSEFVKQYPNTEINRLDKLPVISPCLMDTSIKERLCNIDFSCSECREKYWLEEIE